MESTGFAVPIESVVGLPESGHPVLLGSGSALALPQQQAASAPQSSAAVADSEPTQLIRNAKTIYIQSKTVYLTVDTLIHALSEQKHWPELGLVIVQDKNLADLSITIDRPFFTYVHSYVVSDRNTSVVVGSGKVTAFDGVIASRGIAKELVKTFSAARLPNAAAKPLGSRQ